MTNYTNQDLNAGDIVVYIKSVKIENVSKVCKFVGIIEKVMPKTVNITPITKPDEYISEDPEEELNIIAEYLLTNEITKYDEVRVNAKDVIAVIYSATALHESKEEYQSKYNNIDET